MKNTSVSLGKHYTNFVNAQVLAGRYGSASEVLRAGLRLLEERESRLKAMQSLPASEEESEASVPFDTEDVLKYMRDKQVRPVKN